MYLHPTYRRGRQGVRYAYWRLCDSYRDFAVVTCRRDLINVGRLDGFTQDDINAVTKIVTEKSKGTPYSMFDEELYADKVLALAGGPLLTAHRQAAHRPSRQCIQERALDRGTAPAARASLHCPDFHPQAYRRH